MQVAVEPAGRTYGTAKGPPSRLLNSEAFVIQAGRACRIHHPSGICAPNLPAFARVCTYARMCADWTSVSRQSAPSPPLAGRPGDRGKREPALLFLSSALAAAQAQVEVWCECGGLGWRRERHRGSTYRCRGTPPLLTAAGYMYVFACVCNICGLICKVSLCT